MIVRRGRTPDKQSYSAFERWREGVGSDDMGFWHFELNPWRPRFLTLFGALQERVNEASEAGRIEVGTEADEYDKKGQSHIRRRPSSHRRRANQATTSPKPKDSKPALHWLFASRFVRACRKTIHAAGYSRKLEMICISDFVRSVTEASNG